MSWGFTYGSRTYGGGADIETDTGERSTTDTVTGTDAVTRAVVYARSTADTVTATDSVSTILNGEEPEAETGEMVLFGGIPG